MRSEFAERVSKVLSSLQARNLLFITVVEPEQRFLNAMISEEYMTKSEIADLTDENFKAIVIDSEENYFIEVSADWSGECFLMSRIIEQCAEKFSPHVRFGRINVDLNKTVAHTFGITDLPFLLFFRSGELAFHYIGLLPAVALEKEIKRIYNLETLF